MNPDMSNWSLREAKDWLLGLVRKGVICPCCHQFAKVYERRVTSTMAAGLIQMYRMTRESPRKPLHINQVIAACKYMTGPGDFAKLACWELIEEAQPATPDPSKSNQGFWRITGLGERFVLGDATIPTTAVIYAGNLIRLEGDFINIYQCLRNKFDYRELMGYGKN